MDSGFGPQRGQFEQYIRRVDVAAPRLFKLVNQIQSLQKSFLFEMDIRQIEQYATRVLVVFPQPLAGGLRRGQGPSPGPYSRFCLAAFASSTVASVCPAFLSGLSIQRP